MRLGIVVPRGDGESTRSTLHLAGILEALGWEVQLWSHHLPSWSDRGWASRVLRASRHSFGEWVLQCDHLVWAAAPDVSEFCEAAARAVPATLLLNFETASGVELDMLPYFRQIICPADSVRRGMRNGHRLQNCRCVPWIPTRPVGIQPARLGVPRLFFSLADCQSRRISDMLIDLVLRVSQKGGAEVVLVYRRLDGWRRKRVLRLAKQHPWIKLVKATTHAQTMALAETCDLALVPSLWETTGLDLLDLQTCGCPVVTWDTPLHRSLTPPAGAVLVPAPLEIEAPFPHVDSCEKSALAIATRLLNLIQAPDMVRELRADLARELPIFLQQRSEIFWRVWSSFSV